ncbi:hypothetical protein KR222_008490 [Zaprionus bogoriensis]|nr:hypothetical protein KR222_008490 [Zaprionus bogoriensis]
MAQIWLDEENAGAHMLQRSARKIMGDAAPPMSGKKCVLGILDNVLHGKSQQPHSKSHATPKQPASCTPKPSLCKETLQRQHRQQLPKQATRHLIGGEPTLAYEAPAQDLYARSADVNDKFDLFDFMDFPNEKCLQNCQKPISACWSKPLLSADLTHKLINNIAPDVEFHPLEIPIYQDVEEEPLQALDYGETEVDEELNDLTPPSIAFDDFDFF